MVFGGLGGFRWFVVVCGGLSFIVVVSCGLWSLVVFCES